MSLAAVAIMCANGHLVTTWLCQGCADCVADYFLSRPDLRCPVLRCDGDLRGDLFALSA